MSTVKADLDEIVFKARNKGYGAYRLRKDFDRTIFLAFILTSITIGLLLYLPVLSYDPPPPEEPTEEIITEVELPPPPVDNEEELPPVVEVPPPPPPQREEVAFVPPEIVEDEDEPDDQEIVNTEDLTEDEDQNVGDEDSEGDIEDDGPNRPSEFDDGDAIGGTNDDGPPAEDTGPKYPGPDEFIRVDEPPKATNLDLVKKGLKFPPTMKAMGLQGRVVLKILVDKNGNPIDYRTIVSPHAEFTKEAISGARKLKFSPALQGGRPVPFWVVVPFKFTSN